jgi:hypothetical protein
MENKTNITLEPLISIDAKGNWSGDRDLLNLVQQASSKLGILNYELHYRLLKVYELHKSIYDLEHNRPRLLQAKVMVLAKQCNQVGFVTPGSLNSLVMDIQQVAKINREKFPILPYALVEDLVSIVEGDGPDLIDQLWPYIQGSSDISKIFFKQGLQHRFYTDFYANWEDYSVNPELWFNSCVNMIKQLPKVTGNSFQNIMERTLTKIVDRYDDRDFISVSIIPKLSFVGRLKLFILKNL